MVAPPPLPAFFDNLIAHLPVSDARIRITTHVTRVGVGWFRRAYTSSNPYPSPR